MDWDSLLYIIYIIFSYNGGLKCQKNQNQQNQKKILKRYQK
jgi:hypothetical protein